LHDQQLRTPLLRHPSISQDQQVLLKLLQTSKELQAAVAEHCAGQLPAVYSTTKPQCAETLTQWLRKHTGLLQELHLQLGSSTPSSNQAWGETIEALGAALECAVGEDAADSKAAALSRLCSFSLTGSPASAGMLRPLVCWATQLTKLVVEVDVRHRGAAASAAMVRPVRSLSLRLLPPAASARYAHLSFFEAVAEASQAAQGQLAAACPLRNLRTSDSQLTELRIGPLFVGQLHELPTTLQQLHLTVSVAFNPLNLLQLADWVQQRGSILSSLEVMDSRHPSLDDNIELRYAAGVDALAAALATAGAAPAAAAGSTLAGQPAVAATRVSALSGLHLQSLCMGGYYTCPASGPLLQQLPAHSLTHLDCWLHRSDAAHITALSRLTALQQLNLQTPHSAISHDVLSFGPDVDALAPLSMLQQLTQLWLPCVSRAQLSKLQLPQLQQLHLQQLHLRLERRQTEEELHISHMMSLRSLSVADTGKYSGLAAGEQLPVFLQAVDWFQSTPGSCCVQPLLVLSQLQQLDLAFGQQPPAVAELEQLSTLSSLQEVSLQYDQGYSSSSCIDSAAAWQVLPLARLTVKVGQTDAAAVLQQLQELRCLTSLDLRMSDRVGMNGGVSSLAAHARLAATLRQLRGLRHLTLVCGVVSWETAAAVDDDEAAVVADILQAIGGLQELEDIDVRVHMWLQNTAMQQLTGQLQQLLGSRLAPYCTVGHDMLQIKA
jgi:hypothetical protein